MPLRISDWFFLKPAFTSFKISPTKYPEYLFGKEDGELRDTLLTSLEESTYSQLGYRAIIFGQAGRGKTHLANHLLYTAHHKAYPLELVYVDCPTIPSPKSPVSTFFSQILKSLPAETILRIGPKFFQSKTPEWEKHVQEEVGDAQIYKALLGGLTNVNPDTIKRMLQWLGGELMGRSARGTGWRSSEADHIRDADRQKRWSHRSDPPVNRTEESHFPPGRSRTPPDNLRGGTLLEMAGGFARAVSQRDSRLFAVRYRKESRRYSCCSTGRRGHDRHRGQSYFSPAVPYAQEQAESFLRQLLENLIMREPISGRNYRPS